MTIIVVHFLKRNILYYSNNLKNEENLCGLKFNMNKMIEMTKEISAIFYTYTKGH